RQFAMNDPKIVIIGAGVIGLTTALQLLRVGFGKIHVVANICQPTRIRHILAPGPGPSTSRLPPKRNLVANLHRDKSSFYCEEDKPRDKAHDWWEHVVHDYRHLDRSEVPEFADWGIKYRTAALDPTTYLTYLRDHSSSPEPADFVVNCAGLGARDLGGVEDAGVFPVRGQLVLVENQSDGMYFMPYNKRLGMNPQVAETAYIIERPLGKGTGLGGTHERLSPEETQNNTKKLQLSSAPDMQVDQGIMQRAVRMCPKLVPEGAGPEALRVFRHPVGYRPYREGGTRVELEEMRDDEDEDAAAAAAAGGRRTLKVVHCYGVGGSGYRLSYGVGSEAVAIIKAALKV
ncbi:FAD dependent oxidoreductase, partial [Apiospora phragmitis]